jgi:chemotaxis signal transduction protein
MDNGRGGGVNPDALQEAFRAFGGGNAPPQSAEVAALVQRIGLGGTGSMPVVPPSPGGVATREAQFLVVALAGTEMALSASNVTGVERVNDITPVPNTVAWVLGVANLRGAITSVVDLRRFLGIPPEAVTTRSRVVVATTRDMTIGFLVDGVGEFQPIPEGARSYDNVRQFAPPWLGTYVTALAQVPGNAASQERDRTIFLLDVEKLLFADGLHRYQADL